MPHREFIAAIDDSGGHAALMNPDGTPKSGGPNQPMVGVGAVVIRQDRLPRFEQRWNVLRERIQDALSLEALPPIHVRWMWGTSRAEPRKNPYLHASNDQIARWLRDAIRIILEFQDAYGFQFGLLPDFYLREELQEGFAPYYSDPQHALEHAYLRSREVPRGLFRKYNEVSTYPLIRALPNALGELSRNIQAVGGKHMDIVVDSFTAADGVAAQNVLETARDIAGVSSLRSIQVVQSYSDSPLLQAADLMAWTYNRALTNFRFKKVDQPYREVFGRLMQHGKTLAGRYLRDLEARPPSTTTEVVCIAYALARNAIRADHPQFVDDVFVSIKEFHRRALATLVSNSPGVSVLTEEGHRRAAAFAASKMTGPRSETAAE